MNRDNQNKKSLPEQVDIFRMWIDHGQTPVNDTYGYVVYAGEGMPAKEYPFEVLRNDTLVQAVSSVDRNVLEAVFYNATTILKAKKLTLSVSAPCTVLIEKTGKGVSISVTDAEMNKQLKEIILTINGKKVPVSMPQGKFCGKPAVVFNEIY